MCEPVSEEAGMDSQSSSADRKRKGRQQKEQGRPPSTLVESGTIKQEVDSDDSLGVVKSTKASDTSVEQVWMPAASNLKLEAEDDSSCPKTPEQPEDGQILGPSTSSSSGNDQLECPVAYSQAPSTPQKLIFRMKNVQSRNDGPFTCDYCGKEFTKRLYLSKHTFRKHSEVKFKCEKCERAFKTEQGLLTHKAVCALEEHRCDTCGKVFRSKDCLTVHCKRHTGEARFACDICGRAFFQSSGLVCHRRTHTGELPFMCETCGKRFNSKGALTLHGYTHTGERPYSCNMCGNRFANGSALSKHRSTHSDEKPYQCQTCGKSFRNNDQLGKHRRIHTGEKPHVCTVCSRGFITKTVLTTHMRTHTGEQPYECVTCGRKFSTRAAFNTHQKVHTGEKPYECTACGKRFALKPHLKKHKCIYISSGPL